MDETFRLDLNRSWEAFDVKTGHAVLIPKGSHHAIRMLVLAGLREAYWRQWEGHHVPELRVTIREWKDKPPLPPQKKP